MTSKLTLEQAIHHANERAAALSGPCAAQHSQLAVWLRELHEFRKLAMDSEPVYQVWDNGNWADYEERLWRELYEEHSSSMFRVLYRHAQPAPLLESEPVAYADPQAFNNFKSNGGENAACTKEWMWRDSQDGLIPLYSHAQSSPNGSSPVIPDAWIPVSERLPDDSGPYWCWFGKERPSVIQQRVMMYDDKWKMFSDDNVTHWRPLPAAPQKE